MRNGFDGLQTDLFEGLTPLVRSSFSTAPRQHIYVEQLTRATRELVALDKSSKNPDRTARLESLSREIFSISQAMSRPTLHGVFAEVERGVCAIGNWFGQKISIEFLGADTGVDEEIVDRVRQSLVEALCALVSGVRDRSSENGLQKTAELSLQVRCFIRGKHLVAQLGCANVSIDSDVFERVRARASQVIWASQGLWLEFPMKLAAVEAFGFVASGKRFVLPLDQVERVVALHTSDLSFVRGQGQILTVGEVQYTVMHPLETGGVSSDTAPPSFALLLNHRGRNFSFLVNDIEKPQLISASEIPGSFADFLDLNERLSSSAVEALHPDERKALAGVA